MKKIAVIANPYIALDKDGVPQGVVALPGAPGRFIGAHIDLAASQKAGRTRLYFPGPNEKRGEKGAAGLQVVELELDATLLRAVLEGSLLATTKEGAHLCGIRGEEYLPPEKALEAEREKALAYARALRGDAAKVEPIPQSPTDEAAPEATTDVKLTPTLTLKTEA